MEIKRNPTREVRVGKVTVGGGHPIVVQSMAATKTTQIDATVRQVQQLHGAGAGIVRIAVDSQKDVAALAEVRRQCPEATLSVDLQESYRLAGMVAPHVDKIRYNPGHLHHHEKHKTVREKVAYLVGIARDHDVALRVGVNCGSVDPVLKEKFSENEDRAIIQSALDHCAILDDLGFDRYVVSLKDSDPFKVVEINRAFAASRPDVPVHLGVTEAGLPPDGIIKTRVAFEQLISGGIGDTVRVSLTLPFDDKYQEIEAGRQILEDIHAGRFRSVPENLGKGLNIISCPSCSRVENEAFIVLAQRVKEITTFARDHRITIAVMGCRVNGPGETDDADLGLWCAPSFVNLKRGSEELGTFKYDEVLVRLEQEVRELIARRTA